MAKDEVIIMSEKYSQMKLICDSFCFKKKIVIHCTEKTVVIYDHFFSTFNKYAMIIDKKEYLDKLYPKR